MGRAAQQGRVLAPLELLGVTGRRIPVLRTLAFAFGLVALSLCVDAALRSSGLRESSILPELDREISRASSNATPAGLVLLVLGLAVAPGVAEELLFRGWLLRVFARPFGLARSALITTALFGALHVDPLHAAAAAVLGGYLAAVRIATGSTSAAIACHVANNLAALWIGASEAPPISIALPVAAGVAALSSVWLARTLRSQAAADALTLPGLSAPGHER
jgi:membrane protease YdiL (CAAX protease family)